MNAYTTLANVRPHGVAIRIEPNISVVTQRAEMAGREVDGVVDMRWIPLLIPLLGVVTASMPYLVVWGALTPH